MATHRSVSRALIAICVLPAASLAQPNYTIAVDTFAPIDTDIFAADADGTNARPLFCPRVLGLQRLAVGRRRVGDLHIGARGLRRHLPRPYRWHGADTACRQSCVRRPRSTISRRQVARVCFVAERSGGHLDSRPRHDGNASRCSRRRRASFDRVGRPMANGSHSRRTASHSAHRAPARQSLAGRARSSRRNTRVFSSCVQTGRSFTA